MNRIIFLSCFALALCASCAGPARFVTQQRADLEQNLKYLDEPMDFDFEAFTNVIQSPENETSTMYLTYIDSNGKVENTKNARRWEAQRYNPKLGDYVEAEMYEPVPGLLEVRIRESSLIPENVMTDTVSAVYMLNVQEYGEFDGIPDDVGVFFVRSEVENSSDPANTFERISQGVIQLNLTHEQFLEATRLYRIALMQTEW